MKEHWCMYLEDTAVISVVVLQKSMDVLYGEPGSSEDTRVKCILDGNEIIGIEAERVSDIPELSDQETTIPAIKTEPNVSGVPVVSVTHFSYRPYLNLSSSV
jgi:hypothetical protein